MSACLRPGVDGIKKVVLLRVHPESQNTVGRPIDHCCIGTREVLPDKRKAVSKPVDGLCDVDP